MGFLDTIVLGARLFVWLWFFLVVIFVGAVALYVNREKVIEKWFKLRWPGSVVNIKIFTPGSLIYRSYWRLIPPGGYWDINDRIYQYIKERQLKENIDLVAIQKGDAYFVDVEGVSRKIDLNFMRHPRRSYPELYYFLNCPDPIDMSVYTKAEGFKLDGERLNDIIRADTWTKLHTLGEQMRLLILIIVLLFFVLLAVIFVVLKITGVVK